MSPNQWGPPIWMLFHTMAEKVKEESYPVIGQQIFAVISQICNNLPCPECTTHAKIFLSKVKPNQLKNKNDLKNLLYVFHNAVNARKNKPPYKYEDLEKYKTAITINVFNNFVRNYNTKGNMKLLSDTFHRSRLSLSLRKWFMTNMNHFDL